MKFLSFILSVGLFAQTGIPYYKNGVVTYVNPIGGVVVDVARKQIRTAINGGLRGTPGQLWSVNSNGDGEAINVDWNVFSLLPPGTNGRRTLTLVKQPQLSVIPTVKILSDRELLVCPECSPETPFVFRTHQAVSKVNSPCKIIFPPSITSKGWVDIKAIVGYNFFGSLHGMTANDMPNPTPPGHCSSLQVSSSGQFNYPDSFYPSFIPIAKVEFDGTKFLNVEPKLTPYYSEFIVFGSGLDSVDTGERLRVDVRDFDPPGSIHFVQVNEIHLQTKEIKLERRTMLRNVLWVFQDGYFRVRNRDYTLTYESEYVTLKFSDLININIGDGITVISIN